MALNLTLFSDPVALGSTTSDGSGNYRLEVAIPAGTALGAHEIVVSDGGSRAMASVTVVEAVSAGVLSRTGADPRASLRLAAEVLALGGLLLMAATRRRIHR